ncbi:putative sodium-dependent transporter YocR [Acropora palmata]|uniref:putative sodium-dependent transporter YocR n=1 Tax=Acropora palmata TaxID=6131 RepID=UPI003D9FD68B
MTSQEHSPLVRAYSSSSENQNYNNERFEQLAHFSGKWALVFSCLGCVVGTGNIWRFPRIVANNSGKQGGLQFLLVWLIYLMLWSIPVIITEYTVGRYTRHAPVKSFRVLLGPWSLWCGGWMVAVVVLIASYYSVVVGWCYYYLFHSIFYALPKSKQESTDIWKHLQTSQYLPVLLHFLSLLFTSLSLIKGVSSIEKVNRVIVPLLLLVLLVSFYWSLTLEYASYGITFLFTPDWGELSNLKLWVDAASQNAWDTGAGSGLFLTYASYMTRRDGVVKLGTLLPAANNVISLLSAIMLYSTVFSTKMKEGVNQTEIATLLTEDGYANTGLTFQWMPVLYSELRIPGRILSCLFFLCLSLAGGTSLVALLELPIHTLEEMRIPRKFALPLVSVGIFCIGIPSALNINILINQDFVWAFGQVLAGVVTISIPIRYGVSKFRNDIINQFGLEDWTLPSIWDYIIKFIDPLIAVFLIVSFVIDTVQDERTEWYEIKRESLMTCLVEWLVVLILLVLTNALWMYRRRTRRRIHRISSIRDARPRVFTNEEMN